MTLGSPRCERNAASKTNDIVVFVVVVVVNVEPI
jgi:hypothetical protein